MSAVLIAVQVKGVVLVVVVVIVVVVVVVVVLLLLVVVGVEVGQVVREISGSQKYC